MEKTNHIQPGSAEPRALEIPENLGKLFGNIDRLINVTGELCSRLKPLTNDSSFSVLKDETPEKISSCEVGTQLNQASSLVRQQVDRLQELLNRLEI